MQKLTKLERYTLALTAFGGAVAIGASTWAPVLFGW
jgi:hypothetical protein